MSTMKTSMKINPASRAAELVVLTLAGSLTGLGPAEAQNVDDEVAIEEIIVSASRRDQSLQDVPASVTVLSPEDYKLRGLTSVKSVLQYVPGILVDDGGNPGEGTITARGVPQAGATPVFGIYVDDTPLTSNTSFSGGAGVFLDGMLMDVERIEVIKGPQGTLYGATSVGGMLRYITRDPALDEFRASVGADFSSIDGGDEGHLINGRVSGPLIRDKLGITLSGYRQEDPGYTDYVDAATGDVLQPDADGNTIEGYSADLLFVPTDALDIRLKYLTQSMETMLSSTVLLAGTDSDAGAYSNYSNNAEPGPVTLDFEVMSGTISYDFGGPVLTSTTSYTEFESAQVADFSFLNFLIDSLRTDGQTTTGLFLTESEGAEKIVQEVRLTSADNDNLEWIAGYYYASEETFTTQDLTAVPEFQAAFVSFPSEYEEHAVFGDITYYFTEDFDITAGVRLSKNEVVVNLSQTGPFVGAPVDFTGETIKDDVDTYLLAARYRVDKDLSLYSRVASGYRPAQTNLPLFDGGGNNIANPIVEADSAWSYEIGAKGSFADGKAGFDVSVWKIDWDNFQALVTIGGGVTVSSNASGGLSAQGFESVFTFAPTSQLTMTTSLGYTESELNEDEPGFGGRAGVQYSDMPKWKGAFQADYAFDLSSNWSGQIGGGVRYRDNYVSGFTASATEVPVDVDSKVIADVNIDVTNGRFGFGVYATNLFNERKLIDRSDSSIGGVVTSFGVFERPRTVGLTMRVEF